MTDNSIVGPIAAGVAFVAIIGGGGLVAWLERRRTGRQRARRMAEAALRWAADEARAEAQRMSLLAALHDGIDTARPEPDGLEHRD